MWKEKIEVCLRSSRIQHRMPSRQCGLQTQENRDSSPLGKGQVRCPPQPGLVLACAWSQAARTVQRPPPVPSLLRSAVLWSEQESLLGTIVSLALIDVWARTDPQLTPHPWLSQQTQRGTWKCEGWQCISSPQGSLLRLWHLVVQGKDSIVRLRTSAVKIPTLL